MLQYTKIKKWENNSGVLGFITIPGENSAWLCKWIASTNTAQVQYSNTCQGEEFFIFLNYFSNSRFFAFSYEFYSQFVNFYQKPSEILIGIVLKLYVNLGKKWSILISSLPIHEQDVSLQFQSYVLQFSEYR